MKYLNLILLILCLSISANAKNNNQINLLIDLKEMPPVDLVMSTGDTLTGYFLKKIDMDELVVISMDNEKRRFSAAGGTVIEIILYQTPFIAHIDLINMKSNKRRGDFRPGYAIRAIDGAIRQYNGLKPLSGGALLLDVATGQLGMFTLTLAASAIRSATFDQWIIYKGGKSYRFNNLYEWEDIRKAMFKDDKGFEEYLKAKKVNQSKIEFVLRAYNYYAIEKSANKK